MIRGFATAAGLQTLGSLTWRQKLQGIHRQGPLPDFEVHQRLGNAIAAATRLRDNLSSADGLAGADQKCTCMGVGRDKTVAVAQEHEISVTVHIAARIHDDTIIRRLDVCSLWHSDIDPIVS
jgi:hypothetical protein